MDKVRPNVEEEQMRTLQTVSSKNSFKSPAKSLDPLNEACLL